MSKYEPLREHLAALSHDRVAMTFAEIETVLGFALPASKKHRAWWSNNPHNNVMTRAWLSAGFETEAVDTESERLVFRKMASSVATGFSERRQAAYSAKDGGPASTAKSALRHKETESGKRKSIFGCMKGTLTLDPDVDLTAPADPDLADYLDRKYGAEDFT